MKQKQKFNSIKKMIKVVIEKCKYFHCLFDFKFKSMCCITKVNEKSITKINLI